MDLPEEYRLEKGLKEIMSLAPFAINLVLEQDLKPL